MLTIDWTSPDTHTNTDTATDKNIDTATDTPLRRAKTFFFPIVVAALAGAALACLMRWLRLVASIKL